MSCSLGSQPGSEEGKCWVCQWLNSSGRSNLSAMAISASSPHSGKTPTLLSLACWVVANGHQIQKPILRVGDHAIHEGEGNLAFHMG